MSVLAVVTGASAGLGEAFAASLAGRALPPPWLTS